MQDKLKAFLGKQDILSKEVFGREHEIHTKPLQKIQILEKPALYIELQYDRLYYYYQVSAIPVPTSWEQVEHILKANRVVYLTSDDPNLRELGKLI